MNRLLIVGLAVLTSGCATAIIPQATGGSRADGVIEFTHQYGTMQRPVIDWAAVQRMAVERCAAWGYTGAEPFGGGVQQCSAPDFLGGCNMFQVTTSYQCTGPN